MKDNPFMHHYHLPDRNEELMEQFPLHANPAIAIMAFNAFSSVAASTFTLRMDSSGGGSSGSGGGAGAF